MERGQGVRRISIVRGPYNAYHAEAFGLIFKLSYGFAETEAPRLEIFLDDEEARRREWDIYGTLLEEGDERFAAVGFHGLGEEHAFRIGPRRFRIGFERLRRELFSYPNGSTERAPVYDFSVEALP